MGTEASKAPHSRVDELWARLAEAEDVLHALHHGTADALVVNGPSGHRVYTVEVADQPYRLFVEQMQEGALTLAADDTILYSNQFFADLVGRPLAQVAGSRMATYLAPADTEAYRAMRQRAGTEPVRAEVTLQGADGRSIPVYLSCNPVHWGADGWCSIVVTDLTEQRRVREVAAAREAAEANNRAKDRFLAALSHELRTPLTPVLMAVSALEADPALPPHVREDLALIRRNVELETNLIDDLLDVSRAISGKMHVRQERVGVHGVILSAVQICSPDAREKSIRLTCDLQAGRDEVIGDAARLRQVFWNLIKNAIKFTDGEGSVTIRSRVDGGQIVVEIQDDGIGIESGQLSRIFDPFEQGGHGPLSRGSGLGLGLAISKAVVDVHGGTLEATSDGPGTGAVFVVRLNLAPPSSGNGSSKQAQHDGAPVTEKVRILLVEDHRDTAEVLCRLLRRFGYLVQSVGSAAEALRRVAEEPFDLLISDLGLPDGSGYDLMKQIRQRDGLKGIALSGYGMDEDVQRSHAAGFEAHLTKPVDLAQLRLLIRRVTGR